MALDTDLAQGCNDAFRAGIKSIYLTESCNVSAMTASASDHSFTAVTMVGMTKFYKFTPKQDTASLVIEGSETSGGFENTVAFSFEGLEKTKLFELQKIIDARKLVAVIELNNSAGTNNKALVVGWDEEVGQSAQLQSSGSGGIEADIFDGTNMATITLKGKSVEFPREMVGTIAYGATTVTFGS